MINKPWLSQVYSSLMENTPNNFINVSHVSRRKFHLFDAKNIQLELEQSSQGTPKYGAE